MCVFLWLVGPWPFLWQTLSTPARLWVVTKVVGSHFKNKKAISFVAICSILLFCVFSFMYTLSYHGSLCVKNPPKREISARRECVFCSSPLQYIPLTCNLLRSVLSNNGQYLIHGLHFDSLKAPFCSLFWAPHLTQFKGADLRRVRTNRCWCSDVMLLHV